MPSIPLDLFADELKEQDMILNLNLSHSKHATAIVTAVGDDNLEALTVPIGLRMPDGSTRSYDFSMGTLFSVFRKDA